MNQWFTCFLMFFVVGCINAQFNDKSVKVSFSEDSWYIEHTIQSGETVYGVTKAIGSEMIAVVMFNDEMNLSQVAVGDKIRIPLSKTNFKLESDFEGDEIALYYKVKPLETLYKISKEMVDIDVEDLMKLNNKADHNLTIGEDLLIGYLPVGRSRAIAEQEPFPKLTITDGVEFIDDPSFSYGEDIGNTINFEVLEVDTSNIVNDFFLDDQTPMVKTKKGLATWSAYQYEGEEYLAMHKSARVNSQISLYNPMLKKVVNATVVGQIPENHYANNISVVLSSSAANALGALDKQFLVEMTYIE